MKEKKKIPHSRVVVTLNPDSSRIKIKKKSIRRKIESKPIMGDNLNLNSLIPTFGRVTDWRMHDMTLGFLRTHKDQSCLTLIHHYLALQDLSEPSRMLQYPQEFVSIIQDLSGPAGHGSYQKNTSGSSIIYFIVDWD